ncbi:vigilin-like [Sipha flava]|uniref:Vigilin-like n=1 Tax=Sipha flava TaxID=143950 RepID=A0A8B8G1N2_9HEMI|nr:vigilin-like [Sipha flava]XP_025416563.1 vigilin-like [Sipha flava]
MGQMRTRVFRFCFRKVIQYLFSTTITMMKNVSMLSGQLSSRDAKNNGNSYDIVFPALPVSKTSNKIGTVPFKKQNNVKSSTVNEIISIPAQDRNWDRNSQLEHEKFKKAYIKIGKEYNVGIEICISKTMDLTLLISGNRVNVERAKQKIIIIDQTQIKTTTIPFPKEHRSTLLGKQGLNLKNIEKRTGARVQIPCMKNSADIIYITGTKDSTKKVVQELEEIIIKLKSKIEKEITIDQRHHGAIIGFNGEKVRELQKIFNVKIIFPSPVEARNNLVKIQGLNDDVNKAFKSLAELAEVLNEINYVLEIPIFKQFHKLSAGKRAIYIKKIRKETDTRIFLPREGDNKDVIKVMGNKRKVLIAYDMIKEIQNEIGDIITKEMVLGNVKVRNVIVNLGNKFIQSIKDDCGDNVTLNLPTVKGDNTIVIKGPEDDVKNVTTQIQTMVDEVHKYVFDLKVNPKFHKYLIGTNGVNVKKIRHLTNTRIIFPPETNSTNENITIVGKKENVNIVKAKFEVMITNISKVIEEHVEINEKNHGTLVVKQKECIHKLENEWGDVKIEFPNIGAGDRVVISDSKADVALSEQRLSDHAKVLENTIRAVVNVDPKYHNYFVARRGEIINRIINDCNGVSITFPKIASSNSAVIIKGDKINVEEAKRKIEEIVKDLKNIIEVTMNVPPKYHDHFVAHHAEVINQISGKHNGVTIKFPQVNSNSSQVLIKGHKDYVEKVKNEIDNIIIDLRRSSGAVGATHRGLRDLGPSFKKKTDMNKNRSLR